MAKPFTAGGLFPYGILGQKGLKEERALTDQLVEQIQADDPSGLEQLIAQGASPMTVDQHRAFRSALAQGLEQRDALHDNYQAFHQGVAAIRPGLGVADNAILDAIEGDMVAARRYTDSGVPELVQKGLAMADTARQRLYDFQVKNEEQLIDYGKEQWDRRTALYDDNFRESQPFITAQRNAQAYFKVDRSSAVGQMAALKLANKVILPNEAFMSDDMANTVSTRGYIDVLEVLGNKLANGEALTDEQLRQMDSMVYELQSMYAGEQNARNFRYRTIAGEAGLTEGLTNSIMIPVDGVPRSTSEPAASDEIRTVLDDIFNMLEPLVSRIDQSSIGTPTVLASLGAGVYHGLGSAKRTIPAYLVQLAQLARSNPAGFAEALAQRSSVLTPAARVAFLGAVRAFPANGIAEYLYRHRDDPRLNFLHYDSGDLNLEEMRQQRGSYNE